MLDWIIDRFGEASTWRGIFAFLTAIGVAISPELAEHIIAAGLALMGLLGFLTRDKG